MKNKISDRRKSGRLMIILGALLSVPGAVVFLAAMTAISPLVQGAVMAYGIAGMVIGGTIAVAGYLNRRESDAMERELALRAARRRSA